MKEREIIFAYYKENGRISADCLDIYNWLLGIDEKVAEKWKEKYQGAENIIKKEHNL